MKYGLLTAEEIRSLRERFGVTQGELARLLRLGQNTLSRWETGRNVQTAAMDILLRVLRDVPAVWNTCAGRWRNCRTRRPAVSLAARISWVPQAQ
jgi:transcriptional regulator with XRE-family HTH domain